MAHQKENQNTDIGIIFLKSTKKQLDSKIKKIFRWKKEKRNKQINK